MEQKFPIESDFGKYFLYNLYLRTVSNNSSEESAQLDNSNKFNKCLNLNRYALRGFNCGGRKKNIDQFFSNNTDKFAEFKEKVGDSCNSQISNYLSSYYYAQSSFVDATLYERLSSEALLDSYLSDIKSCLNLDENFVVSP